MRELQEQLRCCNEDLCEAQRQKLETDQAAKKDRAELRSAQHELKRKNTSLLTELDEVEKNQVFPRHCMRSRYLTVSTQVELLNVGAELEDVYAQLAAFDVASSPAAPCS